MSYIKSFDEEEFESLKEYCQKYSSQYGLSAHVMELLDENGLYYLNKFVNDDEDFDERDFDTLIRAFFDGFDFYYDRLDDNYLLAAKEKLEETFSFFEDSHLDDEHKSEIVDNFFEILSSYTREELSDSKALYYLLTSDVFRRSNMVKEYLYNSYNSVATSKEKLVFFVKNLYDLLNKLPYEDSHKVDYIFLSSSDAFTYFLDVPEEMNVFFNERILSKFGKETLSFLFRMSDYSVFSSFCRSDDKFLAVVAAMNEYVLKKYNKNSYFFDGVFKFFNRFEKKDIRARKIIIDLFSEYYDKYFEESKKNGFENDEIFNNLLGLILQHRDVIYFLNEKNIENLDDFFKATREKIDELHTTIFGKEGLVKFKYGVFDPEKDFPPFEMRVQGLHDLKNAFFQRVYGITYEDAFYIASKYGTFVELCQDEIADEDRDVYEIVKTITDVANMIDYNGNKINNIRLAAHEFIKNKGLYNYNNGSCYPILLSLINRMYMRAYNDCVFKVDENSKVLYRQRKVPVIDAGVNFNMIVSSINAVDEFYTSRDNMMEKYNISSRSNNQGICASFINNESLGVISLRQPLIGYANLADDSLDAMGVGDIYSKTIDLDLLRANSTTGEGNYFFTPKKYIDYTRFGYNEMVVDRFLVKDDDDAIKVQPSYIVVYKIDDNYKKTRMYKKGIRMARDFGVPLVLVDVPKVKENERDIILQKEKELFKSSKVDKELLNEIVTRYMNNYSGSLTIMRSRNRRGNEWHYPKDFSVRGLTRFLDKVARKFEDFDEAQIEEWSQALNEVYNLEKEKNKMALQINDYEDSLSGGEFLLDDKIMFSEFVQNIKDRNINRLLLRKGMFDQDKYLHIPDVKVPSDVQLIVDLANLLCKSKVYANVSGHNGENIYQTKKTYDYSEEEKNAYGLVISYLLGDYSTNYFANLDTCDITNIKIDENIQRVERCLDGNDAFSNQNIDTELLLKVATDIEDLPTAIFSKVFRPFIQDYSAKMGVAPDKVRDNFLRKKEHIFSEMSKFARSDRINKAISK